MDVNQVNKKTLIVYRQSGWDSHIHGAQLINDYRGMQRPSMSRHKEVYAKKIYLVIPQETPDWKKINDMTAKHPNINSIFICSDNIRISLQK